MATFGDQLTDTGEVKVDEGLSFGEQIDDSPSNIGTFMAGIGKAVNDPPPFTIGLSESGKSFMSFAMPSSAITFEDLSSNLECK